MIPSDVLLNYILITSVILVVPGPTILYILLASITHGTKVRLPLVLGVMLGDLLAACTSVIGLALILQTHPLIYKFFQIISAIYLIYLGLKAILSGINNFKNSFQMSLIGTITNDPKTMLDHDVALKKKLFKNIFMITVLNPKGIVFFITFFPQFISHLQPLIPQYVMLICTFVLLGGVNAFLYICFADKASRYFQSSKRLGCIEVSAGLLIMGTGFFAIINYAM